MGNKTLNSKEASPLSDNSFPFSDSSSTSSGYSSLTSSMASSSNSNISAVLKNLICKLPANQLLLQDFILLIGTLKTASIQINKTIKMRCLFCSMASSLFCILRLDIICLGFRVTLKKGILFI